MTPDAHRLAEQLARDLRAILQERLRALVVFGAHATGSPGADDPVHTLALVQALEFSDLDACAHRAGTWRRRGLAAPVLLPVEEFARSLDAFPLEFGAIIAHHAPVYGRDPFEGLTVHAEDLRRACEVQVRAHLLHLREGYLETGGEPGGIERLVRNSAAPLLTLVTNLAALDGSDGPPELGAFVERAAGDAAPALRDVLALAYDQLPTTDAARLFPAYLAATERLTAYVDRWSHRT
jgi:hypothetical protein